MNHRRNIFFETYNIPYQFSSGGHLCNNVKNNINFIQRLKLEKKLEVHNGCVNTICWNDGGQYILSGSDDRRLIVTDPYTGKVLVSLRSGHRANIFSAKFMPNTRDNQVVSCSGDGLIYYTVLDREEDSAANGFDCHLGTAYEVLTVPQDPYSFLSCGEDGTVRWFDLRIKTKCNKENCKDDILINCHRAVTAIANNPIAPYQLGVGCSDSSVRIFDRRMLGTKSTGNYTGRGVMGMMSRFAAPGLEDQYHRITSLMFSQDGKEMLVSYSSENLCLFDLSETDQNTKCFNTEGQVKDSDGGKKHRPIKRLRLRGDWSDTGPSARPQRERGDERSHVDRAASTLSDMLTRWLEGFTRHNEESENDRQESEETSNSASAANDTAASEREASADTASPPNHESAGTSIQGAENQETSGGASKEVKEEASSNKTAMEGSAVSAAETNNSVGTSGCQSNTSQSYQASVNLSALSGSHTNTTVGLHPCDKTESNPSEGQITGFSLDSMDTSSPREATPETDHFKKLAIASADQQKQDGAVRSGSNEDESAMDVDDVGVSSSRAAELDSTGDGFDKPSLETDQRSTGAKTASGVPASDDTRNAHGSVSVLPVSSSVSSQLDTSQENETSTECSTAGCSCPSDPDNNKTQIHQHSCLFGGLESLTQDLSKTNVVQAMEIQGSSTDISHQMATTAETVDTSAIRLIVDTESVSSQSHADLTQPRNSTVSNTSHPSLQTVLCPDVKDNVPLPELSKSNSSAALQLDVKSHTTTANDSVLVDLGSASSMQKSDSVICEPEPMSCDTQPQVSAASEPQAEVSEPQSVPSHLPHCTPSAPEVVQPSQPTVTEPPQPMPSEPLEATTSTSQSIIIEPSQPVNLESEPGISASARTGNEPSQPGTSKSEPGTSGSQHNTSKQPEGRIGVNSAASGGPCSSPDLTDDESDSDSPLRTKRSSSSVTSREPTLSQRHAAAKKLQRLYRKCQEEREKEEISMMQLPQPKMTKVYKGHRNSRTMIKEATFWGTDYVMSGSDCGHIFIWNKHTCEIVMLLEGDKHVVNCIQPHPFDPILATSGIDYDVKIWVPFAEEPCYDRERAEEILSRNEIMLEETRDTITVPSSFMLRMLASLNHFRSAHSSRATPEELSSPSTDED